MSVEWKPARKRYVVRSQRDGVDRGKVFSVAKYGSKRAARLAAQEYEGHRVRQERLGYGYEPALARATLREVYNYWLPSRSGVAASTRAKYLVAWRAHIDPALGGKKVATIRTFEVGVWMGELSMRLAPATCLGAYRVLSMVLDAALKAGVIEFNPAKDVRPPKVPAPRQRFLSPAQVEQLASAAGDNGDVIRVLAFTGLRWSELVALRVDDFDAVRRRLRVARALVEVDGRLQSKEPKSGKARLVPLPGFVAEILRVRCVETTSPLGLIFSTESGSPLRRTRWRTDVWRPAVAQCPDLVGLTPRDLRDTYASIAIAAGATPKTLQRAMGHSTASLTLDTYAGLFDRDLDGLAGRLDECQQQASQEIASNQSGSDQGPQTS